MVNNKLGNSKQPKKTESEKPSEKASTSPKRKSKSSKSKSVTGSASKDAATNSKNTKAKRAKKSSSNKTTDQKNTSQKQVSSKVEANKRTTKSENSKARDKKTKEQIVLERISKNPGDPIFAEYAELLRRKDRFWDAFKVCIQGLTVNPDCHSGRLTLARLFYELGSVSFAARELKIVYRAMPNNESVKILVAKIAPDILNSVDDNSEEYQSEQDRYLETMIAETEFDMDHIDLLS